VHVKVGEALLGHVGFYVRFVQVRLGEVMLDQVRSG